MLELSVLIDSIVLGRTVGQRRYGHFDHDAHNLSGPSHPATTEVRIRPSRASKDKRERLRGLSLREEDFERSLDPRSGETLYLPRNQGK